MRSFTSYVSDYDAHRGSRSMNDLTRPEQDELIQLMLDPAGDFHAFVMEQDLDHAEPNGLWAILVALGMLLERKAVIKEFPPTSAKDRDWIINMLAGTRLWLRLEEAFDPFDRVIRPTEYDWNELESFGAPDAIAQLTGENDVSCLKALLDPTLPDPRGMEQRMAYQDFVKRWNDGCLEFFVDRSLSVQTYRLSQSIWTTILPLTFFVGLVTCIPIMIFVGFWWGLALLVIAILARKFLTKKAMAWVRKEAIDDRTRYRWFTARGVIWAKLREAA